MGFFFPKYYISLLSRTLTLFIKLHRGFCSGKIDPPFFIVPRNNITRRQKAFHQEYFFYCSYSAENAVENLFGVRIATLMKIQRTRQTAKSLSIWETSFSSSVSSTSFYNSTHCCAIAVSMKCVSILNENGTVYLPKGI